jgi:hypothetical protein
VKSAVEAGPGLAGEVAARALSRTDDRALDAAVERLARVAGGALGGVVFFGSRLTGAAKANAFSAYDVFVIVDEYRAFYERIRAAGLSGKRPGLMVLLSRGLPPTQVSLRFAEEGVHLKAAVVRADTFRRETSPRRRDHFCIGRLFQPARILYARDPSMRELLLEALVGARRETWSWARPWLPASFDAAAYGRAALGVSMSWEVRPEPGGRADSLWQAQGAEQVPVGAALLRELAAAGEVAPAAGEAAEKEVWRAVRPVGRLERLRRAIYFRRSMARATARWLKHVLSFEGWLDYILRKANRHGGEPVELTPRERRWPWIFLWGRLFRYLRDKDKKGRHP